MNMFIYLLQVATPGAQEPKNENIFNVFTTDLKFPSGNETLRRNARGTPSAMSSSES